MPSIQPRAYGHGYMPKWHRPFLRYITTPDEGGATDTAQQTGTPAPSEAANSAQPGEQPSNAQSQQPDPKPAQSGAQDASQRSALDDAPRDDLLAEVKRLRGENAAKRTQARDSASQRDELKKSLADLLGLGEKEEITPEQLQKQLTEAKDQSTQHEQALRERDTQLAVLRLAPSLSANGTRLLDSRSFLTSLASVDPSDEAAVKTAIQNAVKQDAAFSTIPASSGSHGHQGNGTKPTPKTLDAAISAHYSQ